MQTVMPVTTGIFYLNLSVINNILSIKIMKAKFIFM